MKQKLVVSYSTYKFHSLLSNHNRSAQNIAEVRHIHFLYNADKKYKKGLEQSGGLTSSKNH